MLHRPNTKRRRALWSAGALSAALAVAIPAGAQATPTRDTSAEAVSPVEDSAIVYRGVSAAGKGLYLRRYDVNGAPVVETILPGQTAADYQDPAISPDGTKVAFTRVAGASRRIYVVSVTGSGLDQLTGGTAAQCRPDWASNGVILYTENCGSSGASLVKANLDGTSAGGTIANASQGRYSAERDHLAYVQANTGIIFTANADGSGAVNTGRIGNYPSLDGDGSDLLYQYTKSGSTAHGLAIANADGTNVRTLPATNPGTVDAVQPSWADTGTELYYSAAPWSGGATAKYELYSLDVSGTYPANLTKTSTADEVHGRFFGNISPRLHGTRSTFHPIDPARLLDTRAGTRVGRCVSPRVEDAGIPAGVACRLTVAGGATPVPSSANAVVLNVTGISPTAGTYLTVFPTTADNDPPPVSNLNLPARQTAAVQVQVRLGNAGQISIFNYAGNTHVAVDVAGYYTQDANNDTYHPVAPTRVVDTRPGPGHVGPCNPLGAGGLCTVNIAGGSSPVPSGATAVVLNLTGISPTSSTYLRVYPAGGGATVSNLNLPARLTRANLVTVKVGSGDEIIIYNNSGTTNIAVDVAGYYTAGGSGASFYPSPTPVRILDTRNGTKTANASSAPFSPGQVRNAVASGIITTHDGLAFIPPRPAAVVVNLAGVTPSASTYLTAYPADQTTRPVVSNVNLPARITVPNLAIVAVPQDGPQGGLIKLYNNAGSTPVIMDLFGYYN